MILTVWRAMIENDHHPAPDHGVAIVGVIVIVSAGDHSIPARLSPRPRQGRIRSAGTNSLKPDDHRNDSIDLAA